MAQPKNERSVRFETKKTLQGRFRMKSRLEAARKQLESASDKYQSALEALLIEAAKLVSLTFKNVDILASSLPGDATFRIRPRHVFDIDAPPTATVDSHPAVVGHPVVVELREIFAQASIDFGSNILPNVSVVVRNGKIEQ